MYQTGGEFFDLSYLPRVPFGFSSLQDSLRISFASFAEQDMFVDSLTKLTRVDSLRIGSGPSNYWHSIPGGEKVYTSERFPEPARTIRPGLYAFTTNRIDRRGFLGGSFLRAVADAIPTQTIFCVVARNEISGGVSFMRCTQCEIVKALHNPFGKPPENPENAFGFVDGSIVQTRFFWR